MSPRDIDLKNCNHKDIRQRESSCLDNAVLAQGGGGGASRHMHLFHSRGTKRLAVDAQRCSVWAARCASVVFESCSDRDL